MIVCLCKAIKRIIVLITIVAQIVVVLSITSSAKATDSNQTYFSISGLVDLKPLNNDSTSQAKEGFIVQAVGTDLFTMTNKEGYYELKVPVTQSVYSLKVSKLGYLEREIKRYSIKKDTNEFEISPIRKDSEIIISHMYAGDIMKDNAINMLDVLELAKSFNSKVEDLEYNYCADLNCDSVINLIDVMVIARNFNKTSDDYFDEKTFAISVKNAIEKYIYETKDYNFAFISGGTLNSIIQSFRNAISIDRDFYGPYLKFDHDYNKELWNTGSMCFGVSINTYLDSGHVDVVFNDTNSFMICRK